MKKQLTAAAVALSLIGGAATAIAADDGGGSTPATAASSAGESARSATGVRHAATTAQAAPELGIVGLRSVRRCTFRGEVTTCLINVHRLRVSDNERRVIALGTVTPRGIANVPSFGSGRTCSASTRQRVRSTSVADCRCSRAATS